jgi:hypothetical protein
MAALGYLFLAGAYAAVFVIGFLAGRNYERSESEEE